MWPYIFRRLILIVPTLLGIMLINFLLVQFAPGGPIEQIISEIKGNAVSATERIATTQGEVNMSSGSDNKLYRGAAGLDPDLIKKLEHQFGFDKPLLERFFLMMKNYVMFDFGESFFKGRRVIDLILDRMPISISLGLWTMIIIYAISIPLGIMKAVKDGSRFDVWTSLIISVGSAIPAFLFAVLLIILFAGGSYWNWFPARGLVSNNWQELNWIEKILDYFWHLALPLTALLVNSFAGLTLLTKNSFIEQINMQYVMTARAKGLKEKTVLYGHVFRNAMLIVIAGFPGAFIGVLFTGSVLIEVIFSLNGLGLLGYEAAINRDYPVMFGTLYFFTLLGLILNIVGDICYTLVDPRINFEALGK
ncbi:MAG: microcin C ABC transporter permease YejB [Alphaproteobacteria bacterium]|nr:microcin C ABC transporter permease YejB [Alphaproteobacteria bacterium]